jgi:hypothetical protein
MPIEWTGRLVSSQFQSETQRSDIMGKGNNAQKNDKKKMKPKQDKTKTAAKK